MRLIEIIGLVVVSLTVVAPVFPELLGVNAIVRQVHSHRAAVKCQCRRHLGIKARQREIIRPAVIPGVLAVAVGKLSGIAGGQIPPAVDQTGTVLDRLLLHIADPLALMPETAVTSGKLDAPLLLKAGGDDVHRPAEGGVTIQRIANAALHLDIFDIGGEIGQVDEIGRLILRVV